MLKPESSRPVYIWTKLKKLHWPAKKQLVRMLQVMKENKWPAPRGRRGATNVSADMLLSDRTCDKCC